MEISAWIFWRRGLRDALLGSMARPVCVANRASGKFLRANWAWARR